jgi:hypothetical protein
LLGFEAKNELQQKRDIEVGAAARQRLERRCEEAWNFSLKMCYGW